MQNVLQTGDTLRFSRNELPAFPYRRERDSEVIFSAGRVIDEGGPVTLWQECDSKPNPNSGQTILERPVAERINVNRPYVSVRVDDQASIGCWTGPIRIKLAQFVIARCETA